MGAPNGVLTKKSQVDFVKKLPLRQQPRHSYTILKPLRVMLILQNQLLSRYLLWKEAARA